MQRMSWRALASPMAGRRLTQRLPMAPPDPLKFTLPAGLILQVGLMEHLLALVLVVFVSPHSYDNERTYRPELLEE